LPLLIALVWAAVFYFFKVVPVTEWKVCAIDDNNIEGGGGRGERERGGIA
jgi:hypothetical protein